MKYFDEDDGTAFFYRPNYLGEISRVSALMSLTSQLLYLIEDFDTMLAKTLVRYNNDRVFRGIPSIFD